METAKLLSLVQFRRDLTNTTFNRVFAAAIDLKIDTNLSCTGVREGERPAKDACNSMSTLRQMLILFSSKVRR